MSVSSFFKIALFGGGERWLHRFACTLAVTYTANGPGIP